MTCSYKLFICVDTNCLPTRRQGRENNVCLVRKRAFLLSGSRPVSSLTETERERINERERESVIERVRE